MSNLLLDKKKYDFDRVFRLGVTIAAFAAMLWVLGFLSDVLMPFFVAFLLAYLINPWVEWVQKRFVPHRLGALAVTILGLVVLCALVFVVAAPIISGQMQETTRILRRVLVDQDISYKMQQIIPSALWDDIKVAIREANLQQVLQEQDVLKMIQPMLKRILPGVWGVFSGAASLVTGIVTIGVILMYLVFMLLDFNTAKRELEELVPPEYRKGLKDFLHDFHLAMERYFRGQFLVSLGTAVLFAIGFTLIGMPMGIIVGVIAGLLNMVPYLGLLAIIPATLLTLLQALDGGSSVGVALGFMAAVFIVVQLVQDAVLTPRIMGKVTGLSPAIILLSISVWGKLLGFLGLIIALPLTCLLLATYKRQLRTR